MLKFYRFLAVFSAVFLVWFMWSNYPSRDGYTALERAEIDTLYDEAALENMIKPLTVSDLEGCCE